MRKEGLAHSVLSAIPSLACFALQASRLHREESPARECHGDRVREESSRANAHFPHPFQAERGRARTSKEHGSMDPFGTSRRAHRYLFDASTSRPILLQALAAPASLQFLVLVRVIASSRSVSRSRCLRVALWLLPVRCGFASSRVRFGWVGRCVPRFASSVVQPGVPFHPRKLLELPRHLHVHITCH